MPLIEFVGLPASGKTTIATALSARLAASGTLCRLASTLPLAGGRNLPRKLLRLTVMAFADPATAVLATAAVLRSRQRRLSDAMRTFSNLLEVRYAMHAAGGGVVIMDQGPCQAVWSVAYSADHPNAQGLCRLVRANLPQRRLVVIVAANPRLAMMRSASRGTTHSRVELEGESTVRIWARAVRALQVAQKAASPVRSLTVANPEGDAAAAVEEILKNLNRTMASPGMADPR